MGALGDLCEHGLGVEDFAGLGVYIDHADLAGGANFGQTQPYRHAP